MPRRTVLTARRRDAALTVLEEFLAGHDEEMTVAAGFCEPGEGGRFMDDVAAAILALRDKAVAVTP